MARPTPTARKSNPMRVVRVEWEDFTIPGIDVALKRCKHYNADDKEVKPAAVPAINPGYVFREDMVREFAWATWPHDDGPWTPSLASGPKSAGKTSFFVQMAARCNVPLYRQSCNVGTTVRHLLGRVGAQEARTVYVPGTAVMAMETPAAWLLLDEASALVPPVAMALFPVLEPDGEVLLEEAQPPRYARRSEHFRVYMTDNVLGADMEDARFDYSGTNPDVNAALLDRIGSFMPVGFLPAEQEHAAITAIVPTIDGDVLTGMIKAANKVRSSQEIHEGFSLRMIHQWARRVAAGRKLGDGKVIYMDDLTPDPLDYILACAKSAFLDRLSSKVDRTAMEEIIRHTYGGDLDDD